MHPAVFVLTFFASVMTSGFYINGTYKRGILATNSKGLLSQAGIVAISMIVGSRYEAFLEDQRVVECSVALAVSILSLIAYKAAKGQLSDKVDDVTAIDTVLETVAVFVVSIVGLVGYRAFKGNTKEKDAKKPKEKETSLKDLKNSIKMLPIAQKLLKMPDEGKVLTKHPKAVCIEDDDACALNESACQCPPMDPETLADYKKVQDNANIIHPDDKLQTESYSTGNNNYIPKPPCLKESMQTVTNAVPIAPLFISMGNDEGNNEQLNNSACNGEKLEFTYGNAMKVDLGTYNNDNDALVWRVLERRNIHLDCIVPDYGDTNKIEEAMLAEEKAGECYDINDIKDQRCGGFGESDCTMECDLNAACI